MPRSAVIPVILDEVENARRAAQLSASAADPAAKIRALKKELQKDSG